MAQVEHTERAIGVGLFFGQFKKQNQVSKGTIIDLLYQHIEIGILSRGVKAGMEVVQDFA